MNLFQSLNISASGLSAERLRMDVVSANIANANSTSTAKGGPYRRQVALLAPQDNRASFKNIFQASLKKEPPSSGVRVAAIVEDPSPFKQVYDPHHPNASTEGYVEYPNVNIMKEIVELITASRSYEANVTALNSTKSIFLKTLDIGRS
jgi:flagellar basal-body rod protein FlgC